MLFFSVGLGGSYINGIILTLVPHINGIILTLVPHINEIILTLVPHINGIILTLVPHINGIILTLVPHINGIILTLVPHINGIILTLVPHINGIILTLVPHINGIILTLVPHTDKRRAIFKRAGRTAVCVRYFKLQSTGIPTYPALTSLHTTQLLSPSLLPEQAAARIVAYSVTLARTKLLYAS